MARAIPARSTIAPAWSTINFGRPNVRECLDRDTSCSNHLQNFKLHPLPSCTSHRASPPEEHRLPETKKLYPERIDLIPSNSRKLWKDFKVMAHGAPWVGQSSSGVARVCLPRSQARRVIHDLPIPVRCQIFPVSSHVRSSYSVFTCDMRGHM